MRGGGGSHWGVLVPEGQFHAFKILCRDGKRVLRAIHSMPRSLPTDEGAVKLRRG